MDNLPDKLYFDGVELKRVTPRGMSDYQRDRGNAVYQDADNKVRVFCKHGKVWKAQSKKVTTKYYNSSEAALTAMRASLKAAYTVSDSTLLVDPGDPLE